MAAGGELDHLRDAEICRIDRDKGRPHFEAALHQLQHLLAGEKRGQRVIDAPERDLLGKLLGSQCGAVEELQGDWIDR